MPVKNAEDFCGPILLEALGLTIEESVFFTAALGDLGSAKSLSDLMTPQGVRRGQGQGMD